LFHIVLLLLLLLPLLLQARSVPLCPTGTQTLSATVKWQQQARQMAKTLP
jgi:hypothetical protein